MIKHKIHLLQHLIFLKNLFINQFFLLQIIHIKFNLIFLLYKDLNMFILNQIMYMLIQVYLIIILFYFMLH